MSLSQFASDEVTEKETVTLSLSDDAYVHVGKASEVDRRLRHHIASVEKAGETVSVCRTEAQTDRTRRHLPTHFAQNLDPVRHNTDGCTLTVWMITEEVASVRP